MEIGTFTCSICDDASHKICVYCTKDACNNHLCHRCLCCSECCRCDMPTNEAEAQPEETVMESEAVAEPIDDAIPSLT
jgi:hypothetical protein